MNKKVLFIASIPEHIRAFHIPYLRWFKEQGYETHVAVNKHMNLAYVDKVHIINFHRSLLRLSNLNALIELKKLLDEEKYLLVTCHTAIASALTRLVSYYIHKNQGKLLYTAHGFVFSKNASLKKWIIFFPVEILLSRYTDGVITINHEDYNLITKYGSKKCDYYLIPGVGVDNKRFFPVELHEKFKLRDIFNIEKDKIVLTYVARLEKIKGHLFIIDSVVNNIDLFKNIRILFVGEGELRNKLEKKVLDKGINNIISFLGFRNDIKDIFCSSDYCLSSAMDEGFGINVIEGMMCGLPSIVTRTKGHSEFLVHNYNGFTFDFNNENQFINIIKKITRGDVDYFKLRCAALKTADDFKVDRSLNKMISIYKNYIS